MTKGLSADVREAIDAGFVRTLAERTTDPAWMASTRRSAFEAFIAQGWPTVKQEDWRFTDPSPLAAASVHVHAPLSPSPSIDAFEDTLLQLGAGLGPRVVFVDGQHHPGLSTDPGELGVATTFSAGLSVGGQLPQQRIGAQLHHQNAFIALNSAFMRDAVVVHVPAGRSPERPVFLVFLASAEGITSFPRVVIAADEGSKASVVEVHVGADHRAVLSNAVTEIKLAPGASLTYHTVQASPTTGFHIHHVSVEQGADSSFHAHGLSLGGRIVRNDVRVALSASGAACTLDGLYLASDGSHIDNHTSIEHRAPRTTSREDYRGAVDGKSRAVFSGRIVVNPDAQQTDARQNNRNLLLSEGARVHSKPHLEIFANDVKCSHGATTGRLDEQALFYLRSRGIGAKEASRLLVRAFLFGGLRVEAQPLRQALESVLAKRVDGLGVVAAEAADG
jgi:Fe-S cluster assembly protein SufD